MDLGLLLVALLLLDMVLKLVYLVLQLVASELSRLALLLVDLGLSREGFTTRSFKVSFSFCNFSMVPFWFLIRMTTSSV